MRQIILLAAFAALFLINYSIQKNKSDSVTGMIGKAGYCEITVGEAYRADKRAGGHGGYPHTGRL